MITQIKDRITQIFKKDFIVGLDIGTSSIKIAQFIHPVRKFSVSKMIETSNGARKEDGLRLVKADLKEIKQTEDDSLREQEIVSVLKSLFNGIKLKKSKVIAVINCPKTAIKIARAPYMPKAELRNGITLEAKNYFPFPVDDSLLDYEILGDVVEKGVRKYEVAVAVSPKATVERYLSLLEKAGIKPASFVPVPYAGQKLAERLYAAGEKRDVTACVMIGGFHTELAIFSARGGSAFGGKGPALVFNRKIPVTGKDFTKAMTGVLVSDRGKTELTMEEAEKIKKDVGIPSEAAPKIIDNKISTTQILAMLRASLERLVSEIERCFDYYREESGGGKIDSLMLFGGGASLGGLVKYLSEELGMEVRLGDALEGLKIEPGAVFQKDKVSYQLGLAVGAALTEAKGINLLPAEIKEETKRVIKRSTIEAIATAVIFISSFIYIGMKIQLDNFEKRISVARMECSSLQHQYKKAEAQRLAGMVLVEEPYWEDIFKELSNIIPREIYLTDMRMEGGIITIEGIVSSERGEQILSGFISRLEKGIFRNVKLVNAEDLKDRTGNEFEIRCWVDQEENR